MAEDKKVKKTSASKKAPVKKTTVKKAASNSKKIKDESIISWTEIKKKMAKFPTPTELAKKEKLEPIIEISNLKKSYGKLVVLKDIDLQIFDTQDIGVIGANGAGKSTLSEIVAQVKPADSGTLKYSWGNTKRQISRGMGIQFQESTYPEGYKIIDLIQFYLDV
ncbi:MAG: ATP-binding cassette domain-containing protein, partial [Mycoplasmataceae bacterium]|nr:ATP-binding cassette domain-containing protein [Mycoplasmataceae bacterium]